MKAEKTVIENMRSADIYTLLQKDEEFKQSFFVLAHNIQSQYEAICRQHEDVSECSDDEIESFYSLYNFYRRNIRFHISDAGLDYEYSIFRQTQRTMRNKTIKKSMSHNQIGNILRDKPEDAIDNKSYTQLWEIYGEMYMAFRLGAIRKFQYDKLWSIAYPIITGVQLVPIETRRLISNE